MATITKKQLTEIVADATGQKRVDVKQVVQSFLDNMIVELGKGNRLEFRDFGVLEVKLRQGRRAHNPKTFDQVQVPPKRVVKFKMGRLMKDALSSQVDSNQSTNPAQIEPPPSQ